MALSSHSRAMDHVGVMSHDPGFQWAERVVLISILTRDLRSA
jgi:hypothetical protein